jgi:hypothetical protein
VSTVPPVFYALFSISLYYSLPFPTKELNFRFLLSNKRVLGSEVVFLLTSLVSAIWGEGFLMLGFLYKGIFHCRKGIVKKVFVSLKLFYVNTKQGKINIFEGDSLRHIFITSFKHTNETSRENERA